MPMLKLEIQDITKTYKKNIPVLNKVSGSITAGLLVVIGPNGSGKTTLLRLLAGVSRPSSGRVLFNDADIAQEYRRYQQCLGYLPQEFGFYPEMTGRDFLHYMARLKGLPPSLYLARVGDAAECVGVIPFLDRAISGWSAGLRRRLGVAQALLNDPDVLILDEPMVGLDPEEKLFFWQYFLKLARDRIVIISSNILADFITFADRVFLLVNGETRFNGHPRDLLDLADDKVWAGDVPAKVGLLLRQKWDVSSIYFIDDICQIRIVSDIPPDIPGMTPAQPNIEDAYTYLVRCKLPQKE
jgi:ABC-2 type transport system ATP-binding protein